MTAGATVRAAIESWDTRKGMLGRAAPTFEVRAPSPVSRATRTKAIRPAMLRAALPQKLVGAQYADELAAACEAVRLASTLCKVRFKALMARLLGVYVACLRALTVSHAAMQTVQQQLTSSEKVDKSDDSPVTVADYGKYPVHQHEALLPRAPCTCCSLTSLDCC